MNEVNMSSDGEHDESVEETKLSPVDDTHVQTTSSDDSLATPSNSGRKSRSFSLDSILNETIPSQNGSLIVSEEEGNRSGIGRESFFGGKSQLSPILLRKSEFVGTHGEETNDSDVHASPKGMSVDSGIDHRACGGNLDKPSEEVETPSDVNANTQDIQDDSTTNKEQDRKLSPVAEDQVLETESFDEEEIQMAQRQAGASGLAFLRGLRGAAHRRKMNLARSRDSLVAKEKSRKEEAERLANQKADEKTETESEPRKTSSSPRSFRARPPPKSVRMQGAAGLPKVIKRPVTVPSSPMLGARRASLPAGIASKPRPQQQHNVAEHTSFRARRVPPAVARRGGESGIPKVEKRPTTVPFSPLLGARRGNVLKRRHSVSVSSNRESSSLTNSSDATPVGVDFLPNSIDQENNPVQTPKVKNRLPPEFNEFNLLSTKRAQDRAAFEKQRQERWEANQEEHKHRILQRIGELEEDLEKLKPQL